MKQINRSTDQQIALTKGGWAVCLLVIWLASVGCQDGSLAAVGNSNSSTNALTSGVASSSIDAGIVLADRQGYFCLPIEQVGLPPDAEIVSLKSSCECVQPRLVQYIADRQRIGQAILLEYVSGVESAGIAGEDGLRDIQSVSLGVIVEVALWGGERKSFTVYLLKTVLRECDDLQSPSVYRSTNRRGLVCAFGELS